MIFENYYQCNWTITHTAKVSTNRKKNEKPAHKVAQATHSHSKHCLARTNVCVYSFICIKCLDWNSYLMLLFRKIYKYQLQYQQGAHYTQYSCIQTSMCVCVCAHKMLH